MKDGDDQGPPRSVAACPVLCIRLVGVEMSSSLSLLPSSPLPLRAKSMSKGVADSFDASPLGDSEGVGIAIGTVAGIKSRENSARSGDDV